MFHEKELLASEAFNKITEQTVVTFERGDTFADSLIHLSSISDRYWSLLDEICRSGDLAAIRDQGALTISAAPEMPIPTCYIGPLRARIVSISHQSLDEIQFDTGHETSQRILSVVVHIDWEPTFRLLAS